MLNTRPRRKRRSSSTRQSYAQERPGLAARDYLRSLARLIAIGGTIFGILSGLEAFGISILKHSPSGLISYLEIVAIIFLAVELALTIRRLRSIESPSFPAEGFETLLVREIEKLHLAHDYSRILRYRDAFSRLLWLEGSLLERLRLGELAEEAAISVGDREAQAAALIDDLGWTNVARKDYDAAERAIRHGLDVAQEAGSLYLQAKANRHLAGIYIEKQDYVQAYKYLQLAQEYASAIQESATRTEMSAGVEYGLAVCAFHDQQLARALKHLDKSHLLREEDGDTSRTVRTFGLRGRILLGMREVERAKDEFRKGLQRAREVGRRDEQIINLLGLARVTDIEGREVQSAVYREEADSLMEKTPIPDDISDLLD